MAKKLVKKTPAGKSASKSPAPKVASLKTAPAAKRPALAAKAVVSKVPTKTLTKVLTATKSPVAKPVIAKPTVVAKALSAKAAKAVVVRAPVSAKIILTKAEPTKMLGKTQVGTATGLGTSAVKLAASKPVLKLAKSKPEPIPVRLPPAPVRSDSKMARNKAGISPKELEYFRGLLLEKRREITGDVSSMETTALRSGNGNLSSLPMHMADNGTDNYEQEFTLGLVQKDRELLRDINVALAKIQDGSYGICEGTGKPISKPRLEAQPWAKYSIEHARALERPQFRRAF